MPRGVRARRSAREAGAKCNNKSGESSDLTSEEPRHGAASLDQDLCHRQRSGSENSPVINQQVCSDSGGLRSSQEATPVSLSRDQSHRGIGLVTDTAATLLMLKPQL